MKEIAKGHIPMAKREFKELKAKLKIIKANVDKNVYCKKCTESIIGDKYRCVDVNFKIIKDEFLCSKCYVNVLPF